MAYQRDNQQYYHGGSSDVPAPPQPPPPLPPRPHAYQESTQYGLPYSPRPSHNMTSQQSQMHLQRTPSYQTGDDTRYFDPANSHGADHYTVQGSSHNDVDGIHAQDSLGSQRSQFSVGSSQHSILSHASSHGSSALSGYHQPPPPSAPTPTQTSYNPQHFAQPSVPGHSQSGYNPQAFTATSASPYSNQSYPQYNPAAYHSPASTSYQSSPNSQLRGYGQSPQSHHQSIQSPMSAQPASLPPRPYDANYSGYYQQSQPAAAPDVSTGYSPNQSQPSTSATTPYSTLPPPHHPPPAVPQNSWSNPAVPGFPQTHFTTFSPSPPPHTVSPHRQSPDPPNSRFPNDPSRYVNTPTAAPYSSQSPAVDSAPTPPVHQNTQVSPRRTDTLTRHPHSRPLPGPPVEDQQQGASMMAGRNGRDQSDMTYDEIMREVEAAVMEGRQAGSRRQSSRHSQSHHLSPTNEQEDGFQIAPDELQTHTNGQGNISSTGTGQYVNYDAYSDDSDAEAAAGLAALQMAEEEDDVFRTRRSTHTSTHSSFGVQPNDMPPPAYAPPAPPATESSSDSDYAKHDMGMYGGGYDAHLHYGDDTVATPSNDRPVTTSGSFRSSDRSTDGRDFYENSGYGSAARVDGVGTGGLSEPSLNPRRLSFDDGDEAALAESDTRTSSVGETPDDGEPQDLFFHPGMSSRPLPPPPVTQANNLVPHLMPAGTYRSRDQPDQMQNQTQHQPYDQYGWSSYDPSENIEHYYSPPSAVPRSTSLSNYATAPRNDPIIRSKTDSDRAKSKQPGYDSSVSSPAVPVDLLPTIPAGRRKKFNPAKLSTEQFKKCSEPWALGAIVAWVKDLSEDETDLKEQAVVDAIVALFTHKVPTMNTADAETLGARVVKNMLEVGALVQDEEWVKFGPETLSGVLWQITGRGCYSSRLHDQDSDYLGRCYSHHCMRTLKKINLQAQTMEPEKKAEDWATFYKIGVEVFDTHPKKEIDRQNNLHEIVTTEDAYIAQLDVLRVLYRDQLACYQPPVINPKRVDKFLKDVFGKVDMVKKVNEDFLLAQLKYRQKEQGPFILGFSDIFREWIRKAKAAYIDYAATFPNANYLMRREMETNLLFRQFLDQARENKLSKRLSWDTYLKSPITRIQRYTLMLSGVLKNMTKDCEEKANLQQAIEEIKLVAMECDNKVGEMTKKVDLKELGSKLQLRPELKHAVELNLEHLGREIIHQGDLQRPRTKRFNWVDTRAILFDHYLVLAKIVTNRDPSRTVRYETYDVSKLPIPMDLLVLVSGNEDPVMKTGVKGFVAVNPRVGGPTAPTTASTNNSIASTTVLENPKEDKILYPFKIRHLGKRDVYSLYAPTAQSRQEWCDKIIEAKTKHAASLHTQNAEPFKLRVLSDSAFAYSDLAQTPKGTMIKGTPLDLAIREVEKKYESNLNRPLPVCRASVNCATIFNHPQGRVMCAIGTDYGVYISEYDNPRGWRKAIGMLRVTQIAVFEEFNLFLLIADKSLIAYHLDIVCPVNGTTVQNSQRRAPQKLSGNREVGFFAAGRMKDRALVFYKKRDGISSTFKVLEPVLQKSSSRSRLLPRRGQTEFFREYDEFYIPADSYSINLFHTSLAISTSRGVEVLTLDKKLPWSVPNLRSDQPEAQTHLSGIANRIKDLKPLGMFRLSESEFLVVFEECAVYVNKHGDISRSVVMEFVGHAHSATLCGKFLILLNEDFIEVRNAMNGRLRQVISGQNVALLDDGGNSGVVHTNPSSSAASAATFNAAAGGDGNQSSGVSTGFGTVSRSVKICMQHPEHEKSQVVLELVENEIQKD